MRLLNLHVILVILADFQKQKLWKPDNRSKTNRRKKIYIRNKKKNFWKSHGKHPDKIPVIVERASTEKNLPLLDKAKFLVPSHVSLHEFIRVLRRRMELSPGQALFLMSSRGLPPGTQSIAELWDAVSNKIFSPYRTKRFLYQIIREIIVRG